VPDNSIGPSPPVAEGIGLPWDVPVDDAAAAIAEARARHGDTFVVASGGERYLFTFSPVGVESFYALPEEAASKGLADYLMLRRKLPDEIFAGRRVLPTSLFRRDDVASLPRQPALGAGPHGGRVGRRRLRGTLRSHPQARPPDGPGPGRVAPREVHSNGWFRHSTSWTDRRPSCTPRR
jgi:hypothetical protein